MIVYETVMKEIPHDCFHCSMVLCSLPMKHDGVTVKAAYLKKRHPDCHLREVEDPHD